MRLLVELEETGIVTYREFADEYRVWHGTDVDIRGLVDAALEQVQHQPFVEILKSRARASAYGRCPS